MTDTANLVGNSTILEPMAPEMQIGNGTPSLSEPADTKVDDGKPQSIQDVLAAESKRLKEEDAKAALAETKSKGEKAADDAKAKVDDKEKTEKDAEAKAKADRDRAQDGKFSKAEKAEGEETAKTDEEADKWSKRERTPEEIQRDTEKRKYAVVADRFTPEARAKWDNVPHPVKAELFRLTQERDSEVQRYRQSHERYEQIRQFDDIARTNGRDLRQSLEKVVQIEQALARNPIAGLEQILREVGPRKPDGSSISLYEVAQHIVSKGPQAYQQSMQQAEQPQRQQARPQEDPRVAKLESELHEMKVKMTVEPVVASFAAEHPRLNEIWKDVTEILQSGIIERKYGQGLSHEQRLSEAYRMADALSPLEAPAEIVQTHSETTARPVNPDAGRKSVRGAPSDGADVAADEQETDLRELLRKEMRKISA